MIMVKRNRKPTSAGSLLSELFLKPRGISITDFADAVGVSRKHVSNVIHGRARIEAELATRFATVLGTSADLWLNAQNATDLWNAKQELKNWKPVRYFFADVNRVVV
jgi:addiction module HigA family antidote